MAIWKNVTTASIPVFILLCAVTSGMFFPQSSPAADCVRVRVDLKKLKGLVQRKEFLEKAILECAEDAEITYYYAYNMERLRRYDTALEYYQKVIELDPNFAKAYMGMGDMYNEHGELSQAIAAYEKGLSLDPENVWAKRSLQKTRSLYPQKAVLPLQKALPAKAVQEVSSLQQKAGAVIEGEEKQPATVNDRWEKATVTSEPVQDSDVSSDDFIQGMVHEETAEKRSFSGKKVPSINMPIQFERSSGYLSEEAMSILDTVICPALQSDDLKKMRFEVVGHTDNTGNAAVNIYISRLRAHTIKAYLETRCNIDPGRLEAAFQGQNQPLFPNTTLENRRRNRRVEFRRLQ